MMYQSECGADAARNFEWNRVTEEEDDDGVEPNYWHEACGTEKYINGAHKTTEWAWCEEAGTVVRFTRIED